MGLCHRLKNYVNKIRVFTCNAKKCQLTIATKRLKKHFLNDISIFNELSQPLERVVGLLIKLKLYGHYCFKKGGGGPVPP